MLSNLRATAVCMWAIITLIEPKYNKIVDEHNYRIDSRILDLVNLPCLCHPNHSTQITSQYSRYLTFCETAISLKIHYYDYIRAAVLVN